MHKLRKLMGYVHAQPPTSISMSVFISHQNDMSLFRIRYKIPEKTRHIKTGRHSTKALCYRYVKRLKLFLPTTDDGITARNSNYI